MDQIKIKKLQIRANHGVFAAEKELGQNFYLNVAIKGDFSRAIWEENLEKSVHYGLLAEHITKKFKEVSYNLIETAGYRLAWSILDYSQLIDEVTIEILKPEAPIDLPLETVSFKTTVCRNRIFVALGSNIGDSDGYLNQAIDKINKLPATTVINESTRIKTKPFGNVKQDDFLNSVIELSSYLSPQQLLQKLQQIELELGRERIIKWGPRTIDLDILYFNNQIIYEENLIIPHPGISERLFVLESLNELIPNYIHPQLKVANSIMYQKMIENN